MANRNAAAPKLLMTCTPKGDLVVVVVAAVKVDCRISVIRAAIEAEYNHSEIGRKKLATALSHPIAELKIVD